MYDSIKEMDKLINLSKNFGLINEAFSNWKYELPDDPEQILYDFYFFTNFKISEKHGESKEAKKSSNEQSWEHQDTTVLANDSGDRFSEFVADFKDQNFSFAFREGMRDCTNAVRDHLLHSTMFAMCSEASCTSLNYDYDDDDDDGGYMFDDNKFGDVGEVFNNNLTKSSQWFNLHLMYEVESTISNAVNIAFPWIKDDQMFDQFSSFLSKIDFIFSEKGLSKYAARMRPEVKEKCIAQYNKNKIMIKNCINKALIATKKERDKFKIKNNAVKAKNATKKAAKMEEHYSVVTFFKTIIMGEAQLDNWDKAAHKKEINQFMKNKKNTVLKKEYDSDDTMQTFARVAACVKKGFHAGDDQMRFKPSWSEVGEYFAEIFENNDLFDWKHSYGGKPWAEIARAFVKIYEAKTTSEKQIWIDHAYDLEHNNATFFDKLTYYNNYDYKKEGDENFQWLKDALDWKRDVKNIEEYYNKVSAGLKPIVAYCLKNLRNKSVEKFIDPVQTIKRSIDSDYLDKDSYEGHRSAIESFMSYLKKNDIKIDIGKSNGYGYKKVSFTGTESALKAMKKNYSYLFDDED